MSTVFPARGSDPCFRRDDFHLFAFFLIAPAVAGARVCPRSHTLEPDEPSYSSITEGAHDEPGDTHTN